MDDLGKEQECKDEALRKHQEGVPPRDNPELKSIQDAYPNLLERSDTVDDLLGGVQKKIDVKSDKWHSMLEDKKKIEKDIEEKLSNTEGKLVVPKDERSKRTRNEDESDENSITKRSRQDTQIEVQGSQSTSSNISTNPSNQEKFEGNLPKPIDLSSNTLNTNDLPSPNKDSTSTNTNLGPVSTGSSNNGSSCNSSLRKEVISNESSDDLPSSFSPFKLESDESSASDGLRSIFSKFKAGSDDFEFDGFKYDGFFSLLCRLLWGNGKYPKGESPIDIVIQEQACDMPDITDSDGGE